MKIVICNMGYSSYWVACWRELQKKTNVELQIFTPQTKYPYADNLLADLPIKIFTETEINNNTFVQDIVVKANPDILIICGWASKAFVSLIYDKRLISVKKILIVDTAWTGSLRQILSRVYLFKLVRHFDGIIVGGNRGRKFARWIGFPSNRIYTSIYGYDSNTFDFERTEWPHRFGFVGRYVEIKGLKSLLVAYSKYRKEFGMKAWPLDCFGRGPLKDLVVQTEGVVDHGFVQPDKLPSALKGIGVFVFPSLHEPWGVALAEACGTGLPAIVSDMVASADDLIENNVNGYVFKAGNISSITNALIRIHKNAEKIPIMGNISRQKAKQFAPEAWAKRWMEVIYDICR